MGLVLRETLSVEDAQQESQEREAQGLQGSSQNQEAGDAQAPPAQPQHPEIGEVNGCAPELMHEKQDLHGEGQLEVASKIEPAARDPQIEEQSISRGVDDTVAVMKDTSDEGNAEGDTQIPDKAGENEAVGEPESEPLEALPSSTDKTELKALAATLEEAARAMLKDGEIREAGQLAVKLQDAAFLLLGRFEASALGDQKKEDSIEKEEDQRATMKCATHNCPYRVNKDPKFGSFCCVACFECWGHEHGKDCERFELELVEAKVVKEDGEEEDHEDEVKEETKEEPK